MYIDNLMVNLLRYLPSG